ncbi:MAG: DUF4269 domain-containing protein [Halioglobus sp.]
MALIDLHFVFIPLGLFGFVVLFWLIQRPSYWCLTRPISALRMVAGRAYSVRCWRRHMPRVDIVMSKVAKADQAISDSRVIELLEGYSPRVVSTIFVGFDTHKSDIDIVCEYPEQRAFALVFESAFSGRESYDLTLREEYAVGLFESSGFLFEIYASKTPVIRQNAFRHYEVMRRLAEIGGAQICDKVRHLKEKGFKTEPAICQILGLVGNPYEAVLELENWSEEKLREYVANSI